LTLAYEGTRYAGWQVQAASSALPTVQGALEKAVTLIAGCRVPVHAAGRTDAGVHAEAQVCHLDPPGHRSGLDWRQALNALLPPDIRILAAEAVPASFHAQRDARSKQYAYSLWMDRQGPPPRIRAFVWHTERLDLSLMAEAARLLEGRQNFASFRNARAAEGSTFRTLYAIRRESGRIGPLLCPEDWPAATFFFDGDGFLKQMVRNLMGFLVFVGRRKLDPASAEAILAAGDRRALPSPTAPAWGLTLMGVAYDPAPPKQT
jgi:tRNA pseudouridine38-40 synthase